MSFTGLLQHMSLATCLIFIYVNVVYAVVEPAQNFWQARRIAAEKISGEANRQQDQQLNNETTLLARLPALNLPAPTQNLSQIKNAFSSSLVFPQALTPKSRILPTWLKSVSASHVTLKNLFFPSSWKPGDAMVVHIQDAHQNVQAQKNIVKAIEGLAKDNKNLLLGIEGARGAFNFQPYRSYPDPATMKEIAEYFLKEAKITGPQYIGMTSPSLPEFWGVEDKDLYLSHVQALKDATKLKTKALEQVEKVGQRIEQDKDNILNPALRELDDKMTQYHKAKMGVGQYLRYLVKPVKGPKIRY